MATGAELKGTRRPWPGPIENRDPNHHYEDIDPACPIPGVTDLHPADVLPERESPPPSVSKTRATKT